MRGRLEGWNDWRVAGYWMVHYLALATSNRWQEGSQVDVHVSHDLWLFPVHRFAYHGESIDYDPHLLHFWPSEPDPTPSRLHIPDGVHANQVSVDRHHCVFWAGCSHVYRRHHLLLVDKQGVVLVLSSWICLEFNQHCVFVFRSRVTSLPFKLWKNERGPQSLRDNC